jgi:esterase/lipase superfamily enzyme
MLAATTRSPTDDAGTVFTGDRGRGVSFARIVVAVPPDREPGTLPLPRTPPGNPQREFTAEEIQRLDSEGVRSWLGRSQKGPRRLLVFVHGYNTRFDQAVFRFAQFAHDSNADATPILFSWPSRGRLLDYKRDIDNASYSRTDLANLLKMAAASPQIGEITILAHSMGGWVAAEAMRQIALERSPAVGKINNLILASPDLDVGVFRRQVEDMGRRRPHITIFVASNDRALRLSGFLARGLTRLGAIDPTRDEYQAQFADLPGVSVLDLSALRSNDRINHALFAQSPAIVRLVGDRLIKGQVVTDDDLEAGPVVGAIGSAAALAIAAPIILVRTAGPD